MRPGHLHVALLLLGLSSLMWAGEPELVFRSGFEPASVGNNENIDLTRITGEDAVSGFDWVADLDDHPFIGTYRIEYNGGTASQRWARLIDEPGNPTNRVMQFAVLEAKSSNGNARVQASLYNNLSGSIRSFYQKQRLFLHQDLQALVDAERRFSFFTIAEFWNNANWVGDEHPFRIALNITKPLGVGMPLGLTMKAELDTTGSSGGSI